jgi:hypothetical protein
MTLQGWHIILIIAIYFISVICSHISGYNHGYKDASIKHFDAMLEKDKIIKDLNWKLGLKKNR